MSEISLPRYEIEPRPVDLGGGWRLRLFEGDQEAGGGVFPPVADTEAAATEAYADALAEAESWLASQSARVA